MPDEGESPSHCMGQIVTFYSFKGGTVVIAGEIIPMGYLQDVLTYGS